jgi:hypothetical protein
MVEHLQISMGYLDAHLYDEPGAAPKQRYKVQRPFAAADAYLQQQAKQLPGSFPMHPNSCLTAAEEQELFQARSKVGTTHQVLKRLSGRGLFTPVEVPECPVPGDYVAKREKQLSKWVEQASDSPAGGSYPLKPAGLGTDGAVLQLEKDMHGDLKASWDTHHTNKQQLRVSRKAKESVPHMLVSVARPLPFVCRDDC